MSETRSDEDYIQVLVHRRVAVVSSWISFGVAQAYGAFVLLKILATQYYYENMFMGMNIAGGLPPLTELGLSWWPIVVIVVLALSSLGKELVIKNRINTLIANGVHIVILQIVAELYTFAMFLPTSIIFPESIQYPPPGRLRRPGLPVNRKLLTVKSLRLP